MTLGVLERADRPLLSGHWSQLGPHGYAGGPVPRAQQCASCARAWVTIVPWPLCAEHAERFYRTLLTTMCDGRPTGRPYPTPVEAARPWYRGCRTTRKAKQKAAA